jgi:hypothetical protein
MVVKAISSSFNEEAQIRQLVHDAGLEVVAIRRGNWYRPETAAVTLAAYQDALAASCPGQSLACLSFAAGEASTRCTSAVSQGTGVTSALRFSQFDYCRMGKKILQHCPTCR